MVLGALYVFYLIAAANANETFPKFSKLQILENFVIKGFFLLPSLVCICVFCVTFEGLLHLPCKVLPGVLLVQLLSLTRLKKASRWCGGSERRLDGEKKTSRGSGFAFSRCGSSLCTYLCSADIIANCGFCLETGTIAFVTTSPFLPKEMEFHLKTTFEKLAREIGQGQLHGLLV